MRLKISITGLVQGVGFRPYVYRLANGMGLRGYVLNDTTGVLIEVEGGKEILDRFLIKIESEKPSLSRIYSLRHAYLEDAGYNSFEIRESKRLGEKKAFILPDIAVCAECLTDVSSPGDRRFQYPFTNCTNCGPRFTIIQDMPYDRINTSMKVFQMCPECEKEYHLPSDRRFHAQPDACPVCGPSVSLYTKEFLGMITPSPLPSPVKGEGIVSPPLTGGDRGEGDGKMVLLCERAEAVEKTVELIQQGKIIALKGLGGYHLVCDALNKETIDSLRKRKLREEKPMAVMFPDIAAIKAEAHISPLEERAILSIEKPIVIVRKKDTSSLAGSVSPGNRTVGVFLPYAPLHHIIMQKLNRPVIATSANMTDEPIVKDEQDAFERLSDIADYILTHSRDIVRRCDDSVVKISAERQMPLRRSRGFAPLPVSTPFKIKKPVLALGPYMNNTIAVGAGDSVFISQHIGDLDNPLAAEFYEETIHDFLRLLDIKPEIVVSDMHPGYYSTKFGERHFRNKLVKAQHHFAHILSCMAENDIAEDAKAIGFAFDGTGYGPDKTIWGGEALIASYRGFDRAYHLHPFRLPGGDAAVKEPYRTCFALLYETFREEALDFDFLPISRKERLFLLNMIKKSINSPVTTSMGRLFDGVSSLIGIRHKVSYHAQAAIALEQTALTSMETGSYPFVIENSIIDYRPLIINILNDIKAETAREAMAKKFHNTIADIIIAVSENIREKTGLSTVALSGGVFQNTILLENSFYRLKEKGFLPIVHQLVPPNDGGISLGQIAYGNFCK